MAKEAEKTPVLPIFQLINIKLHERNEMDRFVVLMSLTIVFLCYINLLNSKESFINRKQNGTLSI